MKVQKGVWTCGPGGGSHHTPFTRNGGSGRVNPFSVVRFTGSTREVNKFQLSITK